MSQKRKDRYADFLTRKTPKTNREPNYAHINQVYGVICNNTVGGGDCWGTTMCLCKLNEDELQRYYATTRKNRPIRHADYQCTQCHLRICQCCYQQCPQCHTIT